MSSDANGGGGGEAKKEKKKSHEKKRKESPSLADELRDIVSTKRSKIEGAAKEYVKRVLPDLLKKLKEVAKENGTSYSFDVDEDDSDYKEYLRKKLISDKYGFVVRTNHLKLTISWPEKKDE